LTRILLLSSCGFHLRGQGANNFVSDFSGTEIYLAVTSQDKNFSQQLTRDLQLAGFLLVDEPEQTKHHVIVLNTKAKKRVIGTDRNGRDNEFEINQTAEFIVNEANEINLKNKVGKNQVGKGGEGNVSGGKEQKNKNNDFEYHNQTVRASRTYYFDNNDPIGKKTEENLLNESMKRELSRKIISHLVVGLSKANKTTSEQ